MSNLNDIHKAIGQVSLAMKMLKDSDITNEDFLRIVEECKKTIDKIKSTENEEYFTKVIKDALK